MLAYRTPGVYFEWLDQRGPAIIPLRTDIAGFVGIAAAGPLHTPVRIESFTQFVSIFGGHIPQAFLAYAVEGFFANGGQTCWVVRAADPATARAAEFNIRDTNGNPSLQLKAGSRYWRADGTPEVVDNAGTFGEDITFVLLSTGRDRFTLVVSLGNAREIWRDLSLRTGDPRNVEVLINNALSGSRMVQAKVLKDKAEFPLNAADPADKTTTGSSTGRLQGGADGVHTLRPKHLSGAGATDLRGALGLEALELIDEISIVVMPDIMPAPRITPPVKEPRPGDCGKLNRADFAKLYQQPPPWPTSDDCVPALEAPPPLKKGRPLEFPRAFTDTEIQELQRAMIAHCEKLKDRVAILDTPLIDPATGVEFTPELAESWRNQFTTTYGALYFPWIRVLDPLQLGGLLRTVPPSGHLAGIFARGDLSVGVHKPPANEEIEGVKDVQMVIDDLAHGELNDLGINVVREYRGRGVRVAGARTLSRGEWRYLNVRRLLIMIEEAIDEQTQFLVFEPNNPDTWRAIDRIVRAFLNGLWRRGILDGATADEAYSVRCDEVTNPPEETDNGRVICEVGVLPPWPAEFVVVRIGKSQGGTEILERQM